MWGKDIPSGEHSPGKGPTQECCPGVSKKYKETSIAGALVSMGAYDVSWGQRSPSARSGRMRILKRTLDFIPSMKRNNREFCAEQ